MFGLSPFEMSHAVLGVMLARHFAGPRTYPSGSRSGGRAVRDGAPTMVSKRL
jgi:hypothetical protein